MVAIVLRCSARVPHCTETVPKRRKESQDYLGDGAKISIVNIIYFILWFIRRRTLVGPEGFEPPTKGL